MNKVAIVLLADTETPGDMGRMANALTADQEFKEAGDDVQLIFDGAGVKWPATLERPGHKYHLAYGQVKDTVTGSASTAPERSRSWTRSKRAACPSPISTRGTQAFTSLSARGITSSRFSHPGIVEPH